MDLNCDGVVTMDEFLESCCTDDTICRSLAAFDSSFWPEVKQARRTVCEQECLPLKTTATMGEQQKNRRSPETHCVQFQEAVAFPEPALYFYPPPQHFHHQNYTFMEALSIPTYKLANELPPSSRGQKKICVGISRRKGEEHSGKSTPCNSRDNSPSLVRVRSYYLEGPEKIRSNNLGVGFTG